MKFISLFSGIGGFDLGFERAGMECVAQVEFNAAASSVLARHYPDVERFEDVRHVGRHNLPAADVVCGGFPCQDVSVAGNRAGLAGERSGLWFEFLRILTEVRPRWCVIENVPGLLSSNGGRDFAVLLHGLVECGYGVVWRVLDAQHFGVAQRRRRVFIVGHLGDGRAAEILFEQQGGAGHLEPRQPEGQGTAATISDSASSHNVAGTLGAEHGRNRGLGNENELDFIVPIGLTSELTADLDLIGSLQADSSTGGGHPPMVTAFNWSASRTLSLNPNPITPAMKGQNNGALAVHCFERGVRRLTPTECERLQGFPDGWTAGQSDSQRYKQLGNAVAVPVAAWLGARIAQAVQP